MANKKTAKKLNKKPKIADIIGFPSWSGSYKDRFLVLDRAENPIRYLLLNLDKGESCWYDYELWMRAWKKVA